MRVLLIAVGLLLTCVGARAQEFPTKPITMIVAFGPGTVLDNGARVLAKGMSEALRQPVIVENKPGAAGILGATTAAAAKPDGYTLFYATSGPVATNPHLYKDLKYDGVKSFTYLYSLGDSPLIMVVRPSSPFKSAAELVAYAKANPGKLKYGSQGPGTSTHLVAELLKQEAGIDIAHIPYKNGSQVLVDVMTGVLDVAFDFASVVRTQIEGGSLRGLAVSGSDRLSVLPDLLTLKEIGYPSAVLTAWATMAGPAGLPEAIERKLSAATAEALKHPDVVAYFKTNGTVLLPPMTGQVLRDFVASENAKFKRLVETSGATTE